MNTNLRILHLEDDPLDAKLIRSTLESEGFKCDIILVETQKDFLSALNGKNFDIILADYSLPSFDGLTALELTRKMDPDIPFILISGTLGEEIAIESLKNGATDYVLKQRLSRLIPSVKRALEEFEGRQKRKHAEKALHESEARFRSMFENSILGFYRTTPDGRILMANPALIKMLGYSSFNELAERNLEKDGYDSSFPRPEFKKRLAKKGRIIDLEAAWLRKDGSTLQVSENAWVIRDKNGNILYYDGSVEDITERKIAEDALKVSEEKYKELADSLPQIVFEMDLNENITYANRNAYKLLGYTNKEHKNGLTISQMLVPEDREKALENIKKVLSGEKQGGNEYTALKKDGSTFPIEVHSRRILSENKPKGIRGIIIDLTERKQAEEKIINSQKLLQRIIDLIPIRIFWKDNDLNYLGCNDVFAKDAGKNNSEEIVGRDDYQMSWKEQAELYRADDKSVIKSGKSKIYFEEPQTTPNGDTMWLKTSKVLLTDYQGNKLGVLGTYEDITERKQAEEALRESKDNYRSIFNSANDAFFVLDIEGNIVDVNPEACRMYGYDYKELINKSPKDIIHPDYFRLFWEFQKNIQTSKELSAEVVNIRKDGTLFNVDVRISLFDYKGKKHLLNVSRDITERKAAEEEKQRLASLIEKSNEFIGFASLQGEIIFINEAGLNLAGFDSLEQAKTQSIFDLTPDYSLKRMAKEFFPIMMQKGFILLETKLKNFKTGDFLDVEISGSLLKYDEAEEPAGLITNIRDISERKNLLEQLIQSQKMETVGMLAGGVAHDFNNLLTIIQGYSTMVQDSLDGNDPLYKMVTEVIKAGDRAAALTRQLLAFSRKQVLQPVVLNINDLIKNQEKMLGRLIGEDINLAAVFDPDIGLIKADPGQIEQVIMNLAINARDAMQDGGNLTIETKSVNFEEAVIWENTEIDSGQYAMITVSDNGSGISKEIISKIFEPFFTTKEMGKGTGLGLSTVYGIVRQSGGYINVYSEPGKGTAFKVFLPIVEESAEKIEKVRASIEITDGNETILVVEDEETLLKLTCNILRRRGYNVLEAHSGGSALLKCEKYEGQIDLILTDVVMPELSGKDLVKRIDSLQPDIKVIYMSGYTDETILKHGILDEGINFIQKPFSASEISRKVRDVLDKV